MKTFEGKEVFVAFGGGLLCGKKSVPPPPAANLRGKQKGHSGTGGIKVGKAK